MGLSFKIGQKWDCYAGSLHTGELLDCMGEMSSINSNGLIKKIDNKLPPEQKSVRIDPASAEIIRKEIKNT